MSLVPNTEYATRGDEAEVPRLSWHEFLFGSREATKGALGSVAGATPIYPWHMMEAPRVVELNWEIVYTGVTTATSSERMDRGENVVGFQLVAGFCSSIAALPAGTTHLAVVSNTLMAPVLNVMHRVHPTLNNIIGLLATNGTVTDAKSNALCHYPDARTLPRTVDMSVRAMPSGTVVSLGAGESITLSIRLLTRTGPAQQIGFAPLSF